MQITVLPLKTHGYICHFDLNNIILFLEFSESIAIYSVNFTNPEHNNAMYYSYHATAKHLIRSGKLTGWYLTKRHNHISPALVLLFDDPNHPIMPIREHRFGEYFEMLPGYLEISPDKKATVPSRND